MTLHVSVTAEDIAAGHPIMACGCPLSRAIRRALKAMDTRFAHIQAAVTQIDVTFFNVSPLPPLAVLPAEASRFVSAFDLQKPVQPFEFDLEIKVPLCLK